MKTAPRKPVKPFSREETQAILESFQNSKYFDLILFLFGSGLRIGEALGLQVRDFSRDSKTIWIGKTMSEDKKVNGGLRPTKGFKARVLPLNDRIFEMMERLTKGKKPNDFIFPWRDDSTIGGVWRKRLAELGIEYRSLHSIRKTFVSVALEKGLSPAQVSSLSGHSPKVMFECYVGSVTKVKSLPYIL